MHLINTSLRLLIAASLVTVGALSFAALAHADRFEVFAGNGSLVTPTLLKKPLAHPAAVAVARDGTVFIADGQRNQVLSVKDGQPSLLVGHPDGIEGNQFNAEDAKQTHLKNPLGVALADDGSVLVSDTDNDRVLAVRNNKVRVVAGAADDVVGADPESANPALIKLKCPHGVTFDRRLGIVIADTYYQRILAIKDGAARTIVGHTGSFGTDIDYTNPLNTFLKTPRGVAVTPEGGVVIADTANSRVLRVHEGRVELLAGAADGTSGVGIYRNDPLRSRLNKPMGVAVRGDGAIFIADTCNHRILKLRRNRIWVETGGGAYGVHLNTPMNLAVVDDTALLIADSNNRRVALWSRWTRAQGERDMLGKRMVDAATELHAGGTEEETRRGLREDLFRLTYLAAPPGKLLAGDFEPVGDASTGQQGEKVLRTSALNSVTRKGAAQLVAKDGPSLPLELTALVADALIEQDRLHSTFSRFRAAFKLKQVRKQLSGAGVDVDALVKAR